MTTCSGDGAEISGVSLEVKGEYRHGDQDMARRFSFTVRSPDGVSSVHWDVWDV